MLLPKSMLKNKFHQASVIFLHAYKGLSYPEKRLKVLAGRICREEKISLSHSINVILCSDHIIKKLNTDYRNKAKPTDVLSFN
jgi:ssRNA-specific RNase YbeY (16S rRNA maturation enzyme)